MCGWVGVCVGGCVVVGVGVGVCVGGEDVFGWGFVCVFGVLCEFVWCGHRSAERI